PHRGVDEGDDLGQLLGPAAARPVDPRRRGRIERRAHRAAATSRGLYGAFGSPARGPQPARGNSIPASRISSTSSYSVSSELWSPGGVTTNSSQPASAHFWI